MGYNAVNSMSSQSKVTGTAAISGAGTFSQNDTRRSSGSSLTDLVTQTRKNFLEHSVTIVEGLEFNQYDVIIREYLYLNSTFEGGSIDEVGNEKYFHNIINYRNAAIAKSIEIDVKDLYIDTTQECGYWFSWLLRQELLDWARESGLSALLNRTARAIPDHGSVVWRKHIDDEGIMEIEFVELRDIICDQTMPELCDSQIKMFRHIMSPWEMRAKASWDQVAVERLIKASGKQGESLPREIKENPTVVAKSQALSPVQAEIDVYEVWGNVPETYIPSWRYGDFGIKNPDPNKFVYVMAVVGGVEAGSGSEVLYIQPATEEDFEDNYKEFHFGAYRGRWKRESNTEALFSCQVRINELVGRFFRSLRLGSLHLFQTQGPMVAKNLLTDLDDGDILESREPINPIQTEIRAFAQYQNEVHAIEVLADRISNISEVVTGEALPAGTPFRQSQQLAQTAGRHFEFIREDFGIFMSEVFQDWILPYLKNELKKEHILNITGSAEELGRFDEAVRKSIIFSNLKDFVLKSNRLPTADELSIAEESLADQLSKQKRQTKIEKDFFKDIDSVKIRFSVTNEAVDLTKQAETLTNLLAIAQQNPAVFSDPNARAVISQLMEMSGISPITIAGLAPPAGKGGKPQAEPGRTAPAPNPTGLNVPAPNAPATPNAVTTG